MRRSAVVALVGVQTVLMVAFGWAAAYLGRDEFRLVGAPARADAAPRTTASDAPGTPPVVRIAVAALPIVGIEAVRGDAAASGETAGSADLFATVLDTQPLVDLQARWRAARSDADAARATAAASDRERRRVQALYDDDRNASQRALDAAAAQSLADAARASGAVAALDALRTGARSVWGAPLQAALFADGSADARLAALLSGRDVLLRVALRPDDAGPAPPSVVLRSTGGGAIVAHLVSPVAPGALPSEPAFAGRASLYRAPGAGLSPGMRLAAAAVGRARQASTAGVSVPASAIVWYAGQPWIYLRLAEGAAASPGSASGAGADADDAKRDTDGGQAAGKSDDDVKPRAPAAASSSTSSAGRPDTLARFQRQAVAGGERQGTRWFLPGFDPQATIVSHGAQVLLSEELRSQSHDDDD